MSDDAKRFGDKINTRGFQKGVYSPHRNPGGKPSLYKDLERAGVFNPGIVGLTPADARAKWWAAVLPVAFAGPQGNKDSNWIYAASEVGVRLLGKPRETVEVVQGDGAEPEIDWTKVPLEQRKRLLDALTELELIAAPDDPPVEH